MGKLVIDSFTVYFAGQDLSPNEPKPTADNFLECLYKPLGNGAISGYIRIFPPEPLSKQVSAADAREAYQDFGRAEYEASDLWAESIDGDYIVHDRSRDQFCLLRVGALPVRVPKTSASFFKLVDEYVDVCRGRSTYFYYPWSIASFGCDQHSEGLGQLSAEELSAKVAAFASPNEIVVSDDGFIQIIDDLEAMIVVVDQQPQDPRWMHTGKWWIKVYAANKSYKDELKRLVEGVYSLGFYKR